MQNLRLQSTNKSRPFATSEFVPTSLEIKNVCIFLGVAIINHQLPNPAPLPRLNASALMELSLPIAFSLAPSATFDKRGDTMRSQNRTKLTSPFRRRATVASSSRVPSAVDTSQKTLRFENLFSEPSAATVLTRKNEPVSLIEHVQSRNAAGEMVLLGWLRHFGCTLCKKQASDWISIQPQLESCGKVCMTLIGNGTPSHATDFTDEMDWNGCLFTDPDRRTYRELQFRAGLVTTFNASALGRVITSFREGNKQTWKRIPTDAFQQGGAILVDKNGVVRIFHADAFAGDHVEKDQLVKDICAIAE